MIALDIRMPKICLDCPCSYLIQTGDYAGMTMCSAMEERFPADGMDHTGECIVDENGKRPDECPLTDLVFPRKCPRCGAEL